MVCVARIGIDFLSTDVRENTLCVARMLGDKGAHILKALGFSLRRRRIIERESHAQKI